MKKCEECLGKMREFLLDRVIVMALDAGHFLKLEREIERFLANMVATAEKEKEEKK